MKSTRKEVKEKIREHILDYYDERGVKGLREDMEAVKYGNMGNYQALKRLVEGGNFLIYNQDIEDFLNGLGINPDGKEFSHMDMFNTYSHLIAREGMNLLNA